MDNSELREIISVLRRISQLIENGQPISDDKLQYIKKLAAKCYLSHTNREISLKHNDFQMIVDIMRYRNK